MPAVSKQYSHAILIDKVTVAVMHRAKVLEQLEEVRKLERGGPMTQQGRRILLAHPFPNNIYILLPIYHFPHST